MAKSNIPKTLKDLRKAGYVVPGLDGKGKATIPKMPALVECPTCGEHIPVFVQVRNLTFGVSYPVRKERVAGRVHDA